MSSPDQSAAFDKHSMMVEPDEVERVVCSDKGCDRIATWPVYLGGFHVGDVCDEHRAILETLV